MLGGKFWWHRHLLLLVSDRLDKNCKNKKKASADAFFDTTILISYASFSPTPSKTLEILSSLTSLGNVLISTKVTILETNSPGIMGSKTASELLKSTGTPNIA